MAAKLQESASNATLLATTTLQTTPTALSITKPALTTGDLNTNRKCTQGG